MKELNNYKILYLTQTYPFPANDGGEQGLQTHVLELENSIYADNIKMFFSLHNKPTYEVKPLKIDNRIFNIRKYKNILSKSVIEFFEFFLSRYSRSYNIIDTKELRDAIREYNPEIVILDHIGCYKALRAAKYNGKLIYIAHNIETEFNLGNARLQKNIIKKIIRYICALKAYCTERSVMKRADIIGCVSKSDYEIISKHYGNKTVLNNHVPKIENIEWNGSGYKTLFFCGPADFYPNKDAINWIINELAPKMPDIKFKIAGKNTEKINIKTSNVECFGFVSKDELINLYTTSSAFICPIIYGSGIKMKLVEALGYYMPIIATENALEGLNMKLEPLINRNNLELTIKNINTILNDQDGLINYQKMIKTLVIKARTERVSLDNIIKMVIDIV